MSACSLVGYRATEDEPGYALEDAGDGMQPEVEAGAQVGSNDASETHGDAGVSEPRDAAPEVARDAGESDAGGFGKMDASASDASAGNDADLIAMTPPTLFGDAATAPPAVDAALPPAGKDSGIVDAGRDAGPVKSDAGTAPSCGGAKAVGLCWYLGAFGDDCNSTCASRGGFDTRTIVRVGTSSQGGTYENCRQVIAALGFGNAPYRAYRVDGYSDGCNMWYTGSTYWLDNPTPDFSASRSSPYARIACGCLK